MAFDPPLDRRPALQSSSGTLDALDARAALPPDHTDIHVDSLLAINPDDLGTITAGVIVEHEPIHEWFELSYAQYLTIPRSVLQSMPAAWQARFVACLEELDATIDWRPPSGRYWVQLKNNEGRYQVDPLMDYARGRRRIAHRTKDADQ